LVEYGILGPLEVVRDGTPVHVGPLKQRALLILLLMRANRVMPIDRLINELWAGRPPAQATITLQSYISSLRRTLEPGRPAGAASTLLVWRSPGYLLRVEPDELDTLRFERLVQEGRAALGSDPARAEALLTQALTLWRGDALTDVATEGFALGEIARLTELHLSATEDRIEAGLALGRHGELAAVLEPLVAANPLRERLRGQLMLALYRCGRQADALRSYREGRSAMVQDLGIEPSPALRRLEEEILLQSPMLDWRPGPAAPVPALAAPQPEPGHMERSPPDTAIARAGRDAPSALVGRDAEMAMLEQALAATSLQQGRLVLLSGEPGIGKTRLAEEFAVLAGTRGAKVSWGGCYELEGAPAFWPWVQIVRGLAGDLDDERLGSVLGSGAAHVIQVVPELGERVVAPSPPALLHDEGARFRAYEAITQLLTRVASGRTLVVVLDDLHWADVPSLRLLAYAAGALRHTSVLVLGTYRDVEVGPGHALTETLARLAREPVTERVALRGLTEGDVGRFIAGATGATASRRFIANLHRRTAGNPFFLGELVRLLRSEGQLEAADPIEVPASVREVVGRRLAQLPDGSEQLLTVAALAPDAFRLDVLARVEGISDDQVLDVVEAALAARLIVEHYEPGSYRFAHDLVRETLFEGVSAPRRARLHARYGEALQAVLGTRADEAAAELAHHFCQAATLTPPSAAPAGVGTKGIGYARRAATNALARLAYEDAAAHYQRALVVLRREPEPDKRTRCELLLGLGDARRRCGDVAAARAALEPAFGLARDLGEAEWMARAALDLGSSSSWGLWEDLWLPDETAIRLLEGALAALPEDDSVLRARVLGQLAVQFRTEDELHTRSEQALQMARRLHDPLALTDALGARLVAWPVAGADERLAYADELVAMAHAARLREPAALGRQFRVILLLQRGDVIEAEAELARFEQAARELRQPILLVHLQWLHSMWAMLEGRLQDAGRLAAKAFASHSRANPVGARAAYTVQLAFLRREQGRFVEMEPALREHLAAQPRAYIWRAALLLLLAEEGRLDEARALLDSVVADGVLDLGDNDPHTVTPDQATPPTLSEAIALLGDEHAAQVLYQHLRPFAGRVIVTGLGLHFLGAVDYYLGRLAATVRRWADAERHFGDALARHQEMGARPFLIRAWFHFAEMLLERGDPRDHERARSLLAASLGDAEALGMAGVASRVRSRHQ
jgi:DNA-binding SARP family transcriptional activator/tetratricopeptide (TPR) repeat protein